MKFSKNLKNSAFLVLTIIITGLLLTAGNNNDHSKYHSLDKLHGNDRFSGRPDFSCPSVSVTVLPGECPPKGMRRDPCGLECKAVLIDNCGHYGRGIRHGRFMHSLNSQPECKWNNNEKDNYRCSHSKKKHNRHYLEFCNHGQGLH